MKRNYIFNFIILFVLTGLYCGKSPVKQPSSIFFITLDTTRADFIQTEINNDISPNFAAIANLGCWFDAAFCLTPITLPSHVSMFYSLPPHLSGITNNGQIVDSKLPNLTELLKENGYETAAVISLGVLKSQFGLAKGFDEYNQEFPENIWFRTAEDVNQSVFPMIEKRIGKKSFFWLHYSDPHEPYFPPYYQGKVEMIYQGKAVYSENIAAQPMVKVDLILQPGDNPLVFNFSLPEQLQNNWHGFLHYELLNFKVNEGKTPEIVTVRFDDSWKKSDSEKICRWQLKDSQGRIVLQNLSKETQAVQLRCVAKLVTSYFASKAFYQREITYMDEQFGKLVAFLKEKGVYEDSLFVIMGDHGESMGEYRNHFGHIHYLNKLYTRVPLIVAGHGVAQRGLQKQLVSVLNIAPTILDFTGIKKPDYMKGTSLFETKPNQRLVLETYAPEALMDGFSIIQYPYQAIFYPKREKGQIEYYNLLKPWPGEIDFTQDQEAAKFRTEVLPVLKEIAKSFSQLKKSDSAMSPETLEILQSLGYI
jgi:membrane-anchored protein YejM (alkaline phosphatase superfamily)